MKRTAIYARQSDPYKKGHLQSDTESLSISTQISHATNKANELNFQVEDVYDEQITSEVFEERPELRKLLSRLDRYQAIIVYKYDRIVRNPDQLNAFIGACVAKGVRVISCTEQEIGTDPMSKMLGYIVGSIGQMEKIRMKERIRDAKQLILDKGLILESGNAKYGYQYMEGKRIINPATEKIVKRIFADVAKGIPLQQVAKNLTKEGVKPPRVKWSQEMLGKIIRDPSYHGAPMQWGQTEGTELRSPTNGRRVRVKGKSVSIGENTPPIVTRELWNQANHQVQENRKRGGTTKIKTLWLRGHVFCGQCGHRTTPHPMHNGKYEYRCAYGAAGKTTCTRAGYPIDDVEIYVRTILHRYFEYPEKVKALVAKSLPQTIDWQERVTDHERTVKGLKAKLAKVAARIGDSEDEVINEAINTQMKSIADSIRREQGALDEAIRLSKSARSKKQVLADVDELIKTKGHMDALAELSVKVYLYAHLPGDEVKLIIKPPHNSHEMATDKKGRNRRIIVRLFDSLTVRFVSDDRLPVNGHPINQVLPTVSLT
jgi:DNA invertase Pin-like site-specific DNA recombinase